MNLRMSIERQRVGKSESATEFAEWMKLIHDKAQAVISKVYDDMQISIEAKCLIIKLEIRYG